VKLLLAVIFDEVFTNDLATFDGHAEFGEQAEGEKAHRQRPSERCSEQKQDWHGYDRQRKRELENAPSVVLEDDETLISFCDPVLHTFGCIAADELIFFDDLFPFGGWWGSGLLVSHVGVPC